MDNTSGCYFNFFLSKTLLMYIMLVLSTIDPQIKVVQNFCLYFQIVPCPIDFSVVLEGFNICQFWKMAAWAALLPVIPSFSYHGFFCRIGCWFCIPLEKKRKLGKFSACVFIFPLSYSLSCYSEVFQYLLMVKMLIWTAFRPVITSFLCCRLSCFW